MEREEEWNIDIRISRKTFPLLALSEDFFLPFSYSMHAYED